MKMKTMLVGTALATPAVALAGAGTAFADTPATQPEWLNDGKSIVDDVLDKTGVKERLPEMPAPQLPDEGALPTNVFRKENSEGASIVDGIRDFVAPSAPPQPGNTAGEQGGTNAVPHIGQEDIANAQRNTAVNYIKDGNIEGISRMLSQKQTDNTAPTPLSAVLPTAEEWRSVVTGEHSPFGHENVDRAEGQHGVTEWQNSFMADPLGTLAQTIAIAGGWQEILQDPGRSLHRVVASVAGEQVAGDVDLALKEYVVPILTQDLPIAALAFLGSEFITSLLGGIAGSIYGATLGGLTGAALGAMNPLAPLVGLLNSIPGALLGSLLTGIPGLVGASLIGLSSLALGPLLGTAGGSLLALAALATVVFGSWLLFLGGVFVASIGVAVLAYIGILVAAAMLTPLFLFSPLPFFFAFGGGLFVAILTPFVLTALAALFTIGIPVLIFGLLSIPVALLGALAGGLAGLLGGLIFAAIAVPLLTALSAIPGAIAGGILGYLLGDLATRALSALIGAPIGALIGALLGFLPGAVAGFIAGLPLATFVFTTVLTHLIDRRRDTDGAHAFFRVKDLLDRATWDNDLNRIWRGINDRFWDTEIGRAIKPFVDAWNNFWGTLVANGFNPDMRAALLGALRGIWDGIRTGAILGFLAPQNLLGAIPGGILGAILGALTGAIGGKLASMLLGALSALASMPLTFLPNLLAATALWTLLNAPLLLAGLAIALLPPLALATAATLAVTLGVFTFVLLPIWFMMWLPAAIVTVIGFLINGAGLLMMLTIVGAPLGMFLFGLGWGIAGFGAGWAGVVSTIFLVIPTFALLLANVFLIGVPVFLLTVPFFAFPALMAGLPYLLGLPWLIPAAIGASILEGILIGALVDNLAQFVTIPAGALLGALTGGTIGAFLGWLLTALAGSLLAATIGAIYGAGSGAWKGALLSALLGLNWRGAFGTLGDFNGGAPVNTSADVNADVARFDALSDTWAIPVAASPSTTSSFSDNGARQLHDVTDLVLSHS